ncbi:hypothetical protein GALL_485900 [mine drainage metagenome]|uniref:Uncharacterized protein n=1 Tax=mine drainage metagenome TaxID=410659 RepID=A0A1J5PEK6_9ZZZZ
MREVAPVVKVRAQPLLRGRVARVRQRFERVTALVRLEVLRRLGFGFERRRWGMRVHATNNRRLSCLQA